jgi:site-specific DNA-methyltransferase (adenine-specific)
LLTDPPYGIEFQSDYRLDRSAEHRHEEIAADLPMEAQAEIAECFRVMYAKLTANAHVLCFCHWSQEPCVRTAIESAGFTVRGSLIWVKNNTGMGDPDTTFAPKHERIIHAVKGSPVLFRREPDVLEAARVNSQLHPNEKPVNLLTRLIEATTVEGELVADPFAGVASTLVAARRTNRAYWGCEVDKTYFSAGSERLSRER